MKKVFVVTDFFMSEDELPEITNYVYENAEDAKAKVNFIADTILETVEIEFDSHSEEDGEADAVYKRTETYCEAYKDAACLDWWWWVELKEKEVN